MTASHVRIVGPASAAANNGNWQTMARWARCLRARYRVTCIDASDLTTATADPPPDLLIALHARRSAAVLADAAARWPQVPRVLVLTGTDVYHDIHHDDNACDALTQATRLVVLQAGALTQLSADLRDKAHVIHQSARSLQPQMHPLPPRRLHAIMVGHLRAEKDPMTFLAASALLPPAQFMFTHIGGALEAELATHARAQMQSCPHYRWLGSLPHARTRQCLKRAHVMVISSIMEGGANVIIEALTSGVPVLASDISGNRGMLGDDYAGYFAVGDASALAALLQRCRDDPVWFDLLRAQCERRSTLFSPQVEQAALLRLVDNCLHSATAPTSLPHRFPGIA
ncbi:MAG: TIGR04348 family glycosyltransferase [Pseudomonadota bacterium]|nr:TIGR04348 family glycosyltransferase [Pseudomonadota bacterium]